MLVDFERVEMFELDAVYDHKLVEGVHKVNLGILTDGVKNSAATGVNAELALAVFEAVSKAVSSPLLKQGFRYIPVPAEIFYDPEEATIALGSIREGVEGNSVEEIARAYLRFVQEFVSRLPVQQGSAEV